MPDPAETPPASGNDRFNNAIAIIVALISAFLAVSKIKDDNVVQAIQRAQALTVNSWNQYQAKRMRQFELDLEVQRAGALIRDGVLKDTAENRALMDGWRKEIERYKTELKELSDTANGHEADFKRHNETDDLFDFSESFLTLGSRPCRRGADAHRLAAWPRRRRRRRRRHLRDGRLPAMGDHQARMAVDASRGVSGSPGRCSRRRQG